MNGKYWAPFIGRLVEHRKKLGWSQQGIATKIEKTQGAISRFELGDLDEGRTIAMDYAEAVGNGLVLGVDISVGQLWKILRRTGEAFCLAPVRWLDKEEKKAFDSQGVLKRAKAPEYIAAEAGKFVGFASNPFVELAIYDSLEGDSCRTVVEKFDAESLGFGEPMGRVTVRLDRGKD